MKQAPPWQPWEDEEVRLRHPDVRSIHSVLPHRTVYAIRARCKKLGLNFVRQDLWKPCEDAVVLAHVGRPSAAAKLLPGRSYGAIHARAKLLGATRRQAPWTGRQLKHLREECPLLSDEELGVALGRTKIAVAAARRRQRALRRRYAPALYISKPPLIQDIRSLAISAGISLRELKREVGDSSIFRPATNRAVKGKAAALLRAAKCVQGALYVEWKD